MIETLVKLGRFKTVTIITLTTVTVSIALTGLLVALFGIYIPGIKLSLVLVIATIVPFIVTPVISWYLVSLILKTYKLEKEMRAIASYDSLTGLLSRHAFFDNANHYYSLAKREKNIFSVMAVDLDHFKAINDQYGHAAGDAVLKLFGNVTNSVSRQSDMIGRLGGEEFALILPSTNTDEAFEFAERLHIAINKAVINYNKVLIRYTASIGLTTFDPESDDTIESMLACADQALYRAKHNGRNQTAAYRDLQDQPIASKA
jgi:diguanylate cyclase (GGDEF)-like protein